VKRAVIGTLLLGMLVVSAQASVGERVAAGLQQRGLSPEFVVVLIAMLPIVELRGAVPVGILLFNMPWWQAVLWAVLGNIVPIILVLLLLEKTVALLGRAPILKRFFDWLYERARSKSASVQKYEFWGLATFVGIPLPGTGAWTGAVVAEVLGMSYWRALAAIFVGVLMAAAVVTFLSVLGRQFRWVGVGLILALVAGFVCAVVSTVRRARSRPVPGRPA
jgi:uncharacterized membrane protein